MPLQQTSGAASYDAFGGGVAAVPKYIEDYFSTFLYQGTGSSQTINNEIDLSTKGGLVWFKSRSGAYNHALIDTARGGGQVLSSNTTSAQADYSPQGISAFNTNGFTFGTTTAELNNSSNTYTSWTWAKAPKFFDVVTATRVAGQTNARISHNLGSVPGFVIVKSTDYYSESWRCYHRSLGRNGAMQLNVTDGVFTYTNYWGTSDPTSTDFGINWNLFSGDNYVFYFFAHDAGGFGLTGTDNVISCGSYTGDGATNGQLINLGYEAQWVMIKQTNASGSGWWMTDTMRGWTVNGSSGGDANLYANASDAESSQVLGEPEARGFRPINDNVNQSGQTYIYIAIRRGPMKVPTSGTSVFSPVARTGTGTATNISGIGFAPDFVLVGGRDGLPYNATSYDRLRGSGYRLKTAATSAEGYDSDTLTAFGSNSLSLGVDNFGYINTSGGVNYINWIFKRAPSFFDEVCYTGNGTAGRTVNHNLGVAPELMIVKRRNSSSDASWIVYAASQGISAGGQLNSNAAFGSMLGYYQWNNTAPTASVFTLGDGATDVNNAAGTYVWYGFATCAGVSKVGSYTGTGTTKQIDCGFTGGARFVLIKRTDSTGDWYVWDSARGIVAGNDPYLLLNSTAAEVTNTDYVDTYSAGFEISSTAPAAINASGGSFIFFAVA